MENGGLYLFAKSGQQGLSLRFYLSEADSLTNVVANDYDRIPLDSSKTFEQVVSLATPLPGEPRAMCTDDKLFIMVLKTSYTQRAQYPLIKE